MDGGLKRYADIGLRLPPASDRWSGPTFRAELRTWVASVVGEPTSLEPVKIRPWATVWRAEVGDDVFFAKQNCSTQSFEAALVLALNDLAARHVVPLTAVEPSRGLFLTPDQGLPLGESVAGDVDTWCRVTAAGAQLQLEVARYVDRLVQVGLTVLALLTGLLHINRDAQELHETLGTVRRPLNSLTEKELCPGVKFLDSINAGLR